MSSFHSEKFLFDPYSGPTDDVFLNYQLQVADFEEDIRVKEAFGKFRDNDWRTWRNDYIFAFDYSQYPCQELHKSATMAIEKWWIEKKGNNILVKYAGKV